MANYPSYSFEHEKKHEALIAKYRLDNLADQLAGSNKQLRDLIRNNILEIDGRVVCDYDRSIDAVELARRSRIALGLPPAAEPAMAAEREAKVAANERALKQDQLNYWRNVKLDIAEGKSKADARAVDALILKLEAELEPAQRHAVLSQIERRNLELGITVARSEGLTAESAASRLEIKTPAAIESNPWLQSSYSLTNQMLLERRDPELARQMKLQAAIAA